MYEAEERDAAHHRKNPRLLRMKRQTQRWQEGFELAPKVVQFRLAFTEQEKVVDETSALSAYGCARTRA